MIRDDDHSVSKHRREFLSYPQRVGGRVRVRLIENFGDDRIELPRSTQKVSLIRDGSCAFARSRNEIERRRWDLRIIARPTTQRCANVRINDDATIVDAKRKLGEKEQKIERARASVARRTRGIRGDKTEPCSPAPYPDHRKRKEKDKEGEREIREESVKCKINVSHE